MTLKESFEQSITPKYQVKVKPVTYAPEPKKPQVWIYECEQVFNWFKFKREWIMQITFPICWRELGFELQTYLTNDLQLECNFTNETLTIKLPSELLNDDFYYELQDWLMDVGHTLHLWDKTKYFGYGFDSDNCEVWSKEHLDSYDLPVDARCRYTRLF